MWRGLRVLFFPGRAPPPLRHPALKARVGGKAGLVYPVQKLASPPCVTVTRERKWSGVGEEEEERNPGPSGGRAADRFRRGPLPPGPKRHADGADGVAVVIPLRGKKETVEMEFQWRQRERETETETGTKTETRLQHCTDVKIQISGRSWCSPGDAINGPSLAGSCEIPPFSLRVDVELRFTSGWRGNPLRHGEEIPLLRRPSSSLCHILEIAPIVCSHRSRH